MITQKVIDEMKIKAEEEAKKITDAWYKSFLGPRHPDNAPQQMMREVKKEGDNGRLG